MTESCLACGVHGSPFNPLDPAHWLTKGSRPDLKDDPRNVLTLCRTHHREQEGNRTAFALKYPSVMRWLVDRGWEHEPHFDKWLLPLN